MKSQQLAPLSFVRSPGKRAQSSGFSLLEVTVAIGILSYGLMALAVMQLEALSQGAAGKHSVDAAAVGRLPPRRGSSR